MVSVSDGMVGTSAGGGGGGRREETWEVAGGGEMGTDLGDGQEGGAGE